MLDPRKPPRPHGRARNKVVPIDELRVDEEGQAAVRTDKSNQPFYGTEKDERCRQGKREEEDVAVSGKLRLRRAVVARLNGWRFFSTAHGRGVVRGSGGDHLTTSSNGASCRE